ncbi:MAG TPA: polysaccharide biosynthesis tyrosine autokinase [Alloacidobacterium sp.]|nr:polysaccharide biosynthesis tyrosine autokinase [Alloacidobacterium sp.]
MTVKLDTEPTLRDLLQIYRRRRAIVYGVTAAILIATALYCIFCTRRYEVVGTVNIQKQGLGDMGLEDLMSGAGAGGDTGGSDPLDENIEIETQVAILQSDTLALRTIEALNLENTQDFKPHWNPLAWVLGLFAPKGVSDPPGATLENAPARRHHVLEVFDKNLSVKSVSGTRIIEIHYTNPDPKLTSAVVNMLIKSLQDYTYQTRYDATTQASQWLSDQMGDLRKQSEDLQAKVVNLQRESGVYSLGTTDAQGREQAYSGVLDQLQQATTALNLAEQNRIVRGAIAKAAETGDAEMLSSLAGNSMVGASQTMSNSLNLIQSLRTQEAAAAAALKEAQVKYGPTYPKIGELEGSLAAIRQSINQEISRIRGRAESDYQIADNAVEKMRRNYENAKKQADILNNKAIEYVIVRQEAEDSRELYEDLLKHLKEAGVMEGLKSSNITVVDPGRAPSKPKIPNIPLYMTIALIGGWVLGCGGAFLYDNLDNKINTVRDLEETVRQSILGVLPETTPTQVAQARGMLAVADAASNYVEAMRSIRTALLLSQSDSPPKLILVTSSIAAEGKSLFSLNFATILAQSGKRTLLIDTDLRRGTLRARLNLPSGPGLSDILTGQEDTSLIQPVPEVPNLFVLVAGRRPPTPTDLLESEAMTRLLHQFRSEYDFVILDSAPILPVTDSVTLNTLADATLLIVRSRLTERPQAQRSYGMLKAGQKRFVGVILNGLSASDSSYYGYYGYRGNAYPYAEDKDA